MWPQALSWLNKPSCHKAEEVGLSSWNTTGQGQCMTNLPTKFFLLLLKGKGLGNVRSSKAILASQLKAHPPVHIIWHHYWYNSMRAVLENEVMLIWYALGFNTFSFFFAYSQKYLTLILFRICNLYIRRLCVLHAAELALTPGDPMNEWCPQCSVLSGPAQLLSTYACGFCYGVNSSHIWFSSIPAAFYFSQHYCPFQKTLTSHNVPKIG